MRYRHQRCGIPRSLFKAAGNARLKLVRAHGVDKGKPLYDAPPR